MRAGRELSGFLFKDLGQEEVLAYGNAVNGGRQEVPATTRVCCTKNSFGWYNLRMKT